MRNQSQNLPMNDTWRHIAWLWGVALLLALIVLAFGGCKSRQSTVHIDRRDSVVYAYKYDTTHVTVTDTTYTHVSVERQADDSTSIVFVAGGGSYNVLTGQADGVAGIRTSRKERELSQLIARQTTLLEAQQCTIDSLRQRLKVQTIMDVEKENTADIKPKTSGWHRFLVGWFWVTLAVLIVWLGWTAWKIYSRFTI